jgi:hypothetical protein
VRRDVWLRQIKGSPLSLSRVALLRQSRRWVLDTNRHTQALSLAHFERVQPHSFENQRLQRSLIDNVTIVEVDGAN